jgi:tRNA A37 threonylcarbamoyladenosine biosynthesis protein TsaE
MEQIRIRHMDLYRLSGQPEDLRSLDLDYAFKHCISLIEWPSRLGPRWTPSERLEIILRIDSASYSRHTNELDDVSIDIQRIATLVPFGQKWEERLQKLQDSGYIDDFLLGSSS